MYLLYTAAAAVMEAMTDSYDIVLYLIPLMTDDAVFMSLRSSDIQSVCLFCLCPPIFPTDLFSIVTRIFTVESIFYVFLAVMYDMMNRLLFIVYVGDFDVVDRSGYTNATMTTFHRARLGRPQGLYLVLC